MTIYHARSFTPVLVERASTLARQQQFAASSLPEVGRLLAVLTATIGQGRIGEIGTGYGVGAAWIVSMLRDGVSFFTIDTNAQHVTA
jgi:predicted O-methyltransferase YrrM